MGFGFCFNETTYICRIGSGASNGIPIQHTEVYIAEYFKLCDEIFVLQRNHGEIEGLYFVTLLKTNYLHISVTCAVVKRRERTKCLFVGYQGNEVMTNSLKRSESKNEYPLFKACFCSDFPG